MNGTGDAGKHDSEVISGSWKSFDFDDIMDFGMKSYIANIFRVWDSFPETSLVGNKFLSPTVFFF